MLKALGFADEEMPTLLVHGWWNIAGAKMSKSLGNIVDPDVLADKYGPEALRYYLMSDIATGRDADFSEERLVQRYNTDLANSLGNLLNRSLNMAAKYRESSLGKVPQRFDTIAWEEVKEFPGKPVGKDLIGNVERCLDYYPIMGLFEVHEGLRVTVGIATSANLYIEMSKPWKLAKDPTQAEKLDAVLYTLAESLRIIAILIWPVLPDAAHGIFDQLSWKMDEAGKDSRFRLEHAVFGHKDHGLPDGHQLGKPVPLFPRIEVPPPAVGK